jgi:hypothetical protein
VSSQSWVASAALSVPIVFVPLTLVTEVPALPPVPPVVPPVPLPLPAVPPAPPPFDELLHPAPAINEASAAVINPIRPFRMRSPDPGLVGGPPLLSSKLRRASFLRVKSGRATVRCPMTSLMVILGLALAPLVGGPNVVDARIRSFGIDHIAIRYSEQNLQTANVDNTATPAAMVALLAKIARYQVGLSTASAALLEDLLLRVKTGQQRIKGELPPGTPVAHKTGMSDTRDGKTNATNDVGLVTLPNGHRLAVAVFVHASPADLATRERAIARLARAAYDAFNAPAR